MSTPDRIQKDQGFLFIRTTFGSHMPIIAAKGSRIVFEIENCSECAEDYIEEEDTPPMPGIYVWEGETDDIHDGDDYDLRLCGDVRKATAADIEKYFSVEGVTNE